MRKLGFFSNLLYALRKRMGWCPEQPKIDIRLEKGSDASKGTLYLEKPFSWFILMRPLSWWLGGFLLGVTVWMYSAKYPTHNVIHGYFAIALFVVLGVGNLVPFFLRRDVTLTQEEIRLRLGFSEDVIKTEDIESIEYIGRKRPLSGFVGKFSWEGFWSWGGWNTPPFLGVAWSKTPEGEIKWYFFAAKRHYLKINRHSGVPISIGVNSPRMFANRLAEIVPRIGSDLLKEIRKETMRIDTTYQQTLATELYDMLFRQQMLSHDNPKMILENKISRLVQKGLTREEAIRQIAKEEEVLEH